MNQRILIMLQVYSPLAGFYCNGEAQRNKEYCIYQCSQHFSSGPAERIL
jgi:hypothetical protein